MNSLASGLTVWHATPAGAYFAVAANSDDPLRQAIFSLLAFPDPWPAADGLDAATVDQLLARGWIGTVDQGGEAAPTVSLERDLPELLAALSSEGCALLADQQGLQMAVAGFDERQAPGLAALSSDAVALGLRHRKLMRQAGQSAAAPASWAMVDAAGNSQLGVWPVFIGGLSFALVIRGRPLFAQAAFVRLVRILVRRTVAHIPALPRNRLGVSS